MEGKDRACVPDVPWQDGAACGGGGMWRSGNSPVTNTGMDPAGDKNVGSSPGLGSLACGTFSKGWSSVGFLRVLRFPPPLQNNNGCRQLKLFQIQKDFNFSFLVATVPLHHVSVYVFLCCMCTCVCCKTCKHVSVYRGIRSPRFELTRGKARLSIL